MVASVSDTAPRIAFCRSFRSTTSRPQMSKDAWIKCIDKTNLVFVGRAQKGMAIAVDDEVQSAYVEARPQPKFATAGVLLEPPRRNEFR